MTTTRWVRVESIANAALDRPVTERSAFLDESCRSDEALRREVESLLRYAPAAEDFLPRSAVAEAARTLAFDAVAPDAWQLVGYELVERLGSGCMGDVYRARDLRLERDVAVKVFSSVDGDGDSIARFEHEARAASGLNHPNIVTMFAVGRQDDVAYIVMELVSGRTLRRLLSGGALPVMRVIDIAVQLADGLAAAHDAGVVHRDLKPENVMVTDAGLVKIVDFGIAKRERGRRVAAPVAVSPVASGHGTSAGLVAGTAGYMAPEQAAGRSVDHRADQFSFGAMIHEMQFGRRVFERDSQATTVDAILHADHPRGAPDTRRGA